MIRQLCESSLALSLLCSLGTEEVSDAKNRDETDQKCREADSLGCVVRVSKNKLGRGKFSKIGMAVRSLCHAATFQTGGEY
jgi:hypothetical protein